MIFLYAFIAIFIGWIWIDYYRLIDIYDKEELKYFLLTFFLGGLSIFIVFGVDVLIRGYKFKPDGTFLNDFLYSFLDVGIIEEFAKLVPFLIMLLLFRKQINEPIDYLAFISVSALGFASAENILYFLDGGASRIASRAILADVGHMFDTSLIAYGIILVKFKKVKSNAVTLLGFFLLAALSHGFYDFWLIYSRGFGWIVTLLYFFITISIFATILNNAINNSSFFTYKKVVDSWKVSGRIFTYYAFVFAIQSVLIGMDNGVVFAIRATKNNLITAGFIIAVTTIRLSRFKLIQGRWFKIKVELPFQIGGGSEMSGYASPVSTMSISIKGDSFNEVFINNFYEEYFYMYPVSSRIGEIPDRQFAYIERKLFLEE